MHALIVSSHPTDANKAAVAAACRTGVQISNFSHCSSFPLPIELSSFIALCENRGEEAPTALLVPDNALVDSELREWCALNNVTLI